MEAYSNDQQPAVMNLSVRYQIDSSRVDEVYRNFGTRQALIDRQVTRILLEEAKNVLGQFNAATSIRERAAALADIPLLVELVKAEAWDGKLPTTMLPNSTVPFIEANKQ